MTKQDTWLKTFYTYKIKGIFDDYPIPILGISGYIKHDPVDTLQLAAQMIAATNNEL